MINLEQISYGGWNTCWRIANDQVEMVITGEVGPRILRFGFIGGENHFYEDQNALGLTGGDEWRLYGGHRLWHAPEARPRSYFPDNTPISVTRQGDGVLITQPPEPTTGIRKQMLVRLRPDAPLAMITHRLVNMGQWPVTLAVWGITALAGGGVGILPLPTAAPPGTLSASASLSLWPYTDLGDPRYQWGRRYLRLHQGAGEPQKIGASPGGRWLAYARNSELFIKSAFPMPGPGYPDRGAAFEIYTDDQMLELESLGPLRPVSPGRFIEHMEVWTLHRDVPMLTSDADIDQHVLPHVPQQVPAARRPPGGVGRSRN
jgi:hypothetical protein